MRVRALGPIQPRALSRLPYCGEQHGATAGYLRVAGAAGIVFCGRSHKNHHYCDPDHSDHCFFHNVSPAAFAYTPYRAIFMPKMTEIVLFLIFIGETPGCGNY